MARETRDTGLWTEDSVKDLSVHQQWLYTLLRHSTDANRCGVIPWRPARIAKLASDGNPVLVRKTGRQLVTTRHLVLDEDWEEVMVRTFIRHERILRLPYVAAQLTRDFADLASPTIRIVVLSELRRMWDLTDESSAERKGLRLVLGVDPRALYSGGEQIDRIRGAVHPGIAEAARQADGTTVAAYPGGAWSADPPPDPLPPDDPDPLPPDAQTPPQTSPGPSCGGARPHAALLPQEKKDRPTLRPDGRRAPSPRSATHDGSHPNCRRCGTNPRAEGRHPRAQGTNLLGPPEPSQADAWLARKIAETSSSITTAQPETTQGVPVAVPSVHADGLPPPGRCMGTQANVTAISGSRATTHQRQDGAA